ncbi:sigma factor-like helix-turn-helix DNA-binding protein [Bacillus sp. JJ1503]|uniref:sigma factor-like helix-turn-helix DNA-binding protein n=1 Tax=Bacillus sp. JJ1503 TaxID=3122956 RepID=UPI002FFEC1CA
MVERQYAGDYDAIVILVDLATAIERAGLTDRQREALSLVYVEDLTQEKAGERMGIRREAVKRHVIVAETKIARVYESWARKGEGYSLNIGEETE